MLAVGQFWLSSARTAHGVVIRACGRFVLGHGAAETLWTPFLDRGAHRRVDLDLSGVTEIDAQGVGVLASLVRYARSRGATLSVQAASEAAHTLARVTRLDSVLPGAWNDRRGGARSCVERQDVIRKPARIWSGQALFEGAAARDAAYCCGRVPAGRYVPTAGSCAPVRSVGSGFPATIG